MTHLIGLCGEYGSGKSLLAEYMKKKGFIEYAFAYPLKQIALSVGFSYNEVYGTQQDKETKNTYWGISAREFLQKFGTEICREQLPQIIPQMENVFIRCFEKKYTETKSNMVVSDVRFIDEVISIKKLGGVIIKIIREIDRDADISKHKSEQQMKEIKYDYIIINNSTKENLYKKIDHILNELN